MSSMKHSAYTQRKIINRNVFKEHI
jgi:chromosome segregation ATPase